MQCINNEGSTSHLEAYWSRLDKLSKRAYTSSLAEITEMKGDLHEEGK